MNLIIKSLNFSYENEEVFKNLNLNFKSGVINEKEFIKAKEKILK